MNYYERVIEILEKTSIEERNKMFLVIAKENPSIVVRAYDKIQHTGWGSVCIEVFNSIGKIEAIKKCRQLTGMGLKEAKEAIEKLVESENK